MEFSYLLWVDCSAQVGELIVFYSETVACNLSNKRGNKHHLCHVFWKHTRKSVTLDGSDCVCICVCVGRGGGGTCEKSVRSSLWPGISRCLEKK